VYKYKVFDIHVLLEQTTRTVICVESDVLINSFPYKRFYYVSYTKMHRFLQSDMARK